MKQQEIDYKDIVRLGFTENKDPDPKGRQMSGRVTIECIGDGKNHPQFEIKDK